MQPQFFMERVEFILDLHGTGAVLTCTEIQQDVYLQKTKECLHYKIIRQKALENSNTENNFRKEVRSKEGRRVVKNE